MSDLREAIQDCLRTNFIVPDTADAILALLREHGLVELDGKQELPDWCAGTAQEERKQLLKAGFRKVKEIA